MECNKDEAERAKQIAERKFTEKDLNGAKKFALKAQALFPPLDGISQFITAVEVHLMAESRVAGEKDWYAIMSLSPSADDSTVKKQYRHLALQLHPDKNRSPGADGAFKLVQEAFNVLKDKNKRDMFDQKRKNHAVNEHSMGSTGFNGFNGFNSQEKGAGSDMRSKFQAQGAPQKATRPVPQPPPSAAGCSAQGAPRRAAQPVPRPPKPRTARCSVKHASQTAARPVLQPNTTSCSTQGMAQNAARMGSRPCEPRTTEHHMHSAKQRSEQPAAQPPEATTFWTRCTFCRMWFEYSLLFQNSFLFCRSCAASFFAADVGQPEIRYKFEEMQAWKCANLVPAEGSNGSSISNQGSSENVSANSGSQQQRRPYKRMRGEGSSNANGGSC